METTKGQYFHPTFSHDPPRCLRERTPSARVPRTWDLGNGQSVESGPWNPWGIRGVKVGRNHQKWGEHSNIYSEIYGLYRIIYGSSETSG